MKAIYYFVLFLYAILYSFVLRDKYLELLETSPGIQPYQMILLVGILIFRILLLILPVAIMTDKRFRTRTTLMYVLQVISVMLITCIREYFSDMNGLDKFQILATLIFIELLLAYLEYILSKLRPYA